MKSQMEIKVEFLGGTSITQAVTEAKEKAKAFDVAYILFDFNGVSFSIGRDCNVEDVVERWQNRETEFGICAP